MLLQRRARRCPPLLLEEGVPVIIAPHPDDETFGCGGLCATLAGKTAGETGTIGPAHVVFLTSGDASHKDCCQLPSQVLRGRREATAKRAAKFIGLNSEAFHFWGLPDGQLPHPGGKFFSEAVGRLAGLLSELKPRQVFVTHPSEGWSDHIAAEEITRAALAQMKSAPALYHYCVWFWIKTPVGSRLVDWSAGRVLDIAQVRAQKGKAVEAYLEDTAPCGAPYCGKLPRQFLESYGWDQELFFRVS